MANRRTKMANMATNYAEHPPAQKTWQTGKLNFFSDATGHSTKSYGVE